MIIVELNGGLGNQLFQYAFAKYASIKLQRHFVFNPVSKRNIILGSKLLGCKNFRIADKKLIKNTLGYQSVNSLRKLIISNNYLSRLIRKKYLL